MLRVARDTMNHRDEASIASYRQAVQFNVPSIAMGMIGDPKFILLSGDVHSGFTIKPASEDTFGRLQVKDVSSNYAYIQVGFGRLHLNRIDKKRKGVKLKTEVENDSHGVPVIKLGGPPVDWISGTDFWTESHQQDRKPVEAVLSRNPSGGMIAASGSGEAKTDGFVQVLTSDPPQKEEPSFVSSVVPQKEEPERPPLETRIPPAPPPVEEIVLSTPKEILRELNAALQDVKVLKEALERKTGLSFKIVKYRAIPDDGV